MSKFHTRFDHNHPISPSGGPSLTDQQFISDCDINCILNRYRITGSLPQTLRSGVFADVSSVTNFADMFEKVRLASEDFNALPSSIRDRFGSDAAAFYRFALNPDNVNECIKLGILEVSDADDSPLKILKRMEKTLSKSVTASRSTDVRTSADQPSVT